MIIEHGIAVRDDNVTATKIWMGANIDGVVTGVWILLQKDVS